MATLTRSVSARAGALVRAVQNRARRVPSGPVYSAFNTNVSRGGPGRRFYGRRSPFDEASPLVARSSSLSLEPGDASDLSHFFGGYPGMFMTSPSRMAELATRMLEGITDEFNVKPAGFGGVRVDVVEKPGEYLLTADLPGLGDEDVRIHVDNRVLTISAGHEETKESKEGQQGEERVLRVERRSRSYRRSFRLPQDVNEEGITASMDKGVLTMSMPRSGPKPSGRDIPLLKNKAHDASKQIDDKAKASKH